ncbi:hypothetical protein D9M71_845830 [compost metagenome]
MRPTSCLRSLRRVSLRFMPRQPIQENGLVRPTAQPMLRSSGVTEASVSWPMMMKPFSARRTCMVSVPYGVRPYFSPCSTSFSSTPMA